MEKTSDSYHDISSVVLVGTREYDSRIQESKSCVLPITPHPNVWEDFHLPVVSPNQKYFMNLTHTFAITATTLRLREGSNLLSLIHAVVPI